MLRKWIDTTVVWATILLAGSGLVHACGAYLPNGVLYEDYALKVPIGYFAEEIELIEPPFDPEFEALIPDRAGRYGQIRQYGQQTDSGDVADLHSAMQQAGLADNERKRIMASYESVRATITEYAAKRVAWQWREATSWRKKGNPGPFFTSPDIPEGLPGEFEEYIRGAVSYHNGDMDEAAATWKKLLGRPAKQRKYKSTWAAFMIGKAVLQSDPNESVEWFQRVRSMVREGFADSIGLAASSLGWEARAELNRAGYARAIELYMVQRLTGDPTAMRSLQVACAAAVKAEPAAVRKVVQSTTARRVGTVYLISRIKSWPCPPSESWVEAIRKWLDAVEDADVDMVREAEHFAWTAYYSGDTDLTAKWLKLAPKDSAMAQWLAAKLLLRAGKVDEAAEKLREASRQFAPAPRAKDERQHFSYCYEEGWPEESHAKSVRGELGVLYLARRQYVEALDILLTGGHWLDAAYVAERVLTPQELKDYVDRAWPPNDPGADDRLGEWPRWEAKGPEWTSTKIRWLLARRLARLGKWEEAREYYPAQWRSRFDIYARSLTAGSSVKLSKSERAKAIWKAAIIARYEGMELLGTEVEPDWSMIEGSFYLGSRAWARQEPESEGKVLPSTSDEIRRARQHVAVPNLRFHYRYAAMQIAWRAAELMPDNSEETARVLCIAGSWLKAKDPNEADQFYKELVLRCPNTEIGREAKRLRWFPKIDMDRKRLLAETVIE